MIDDLTVNLELCGKKNQDSSRPHLRTIVINPLRQIVYQSRKGWSVEDFLGRLQGQQSI